MTSFLPDHFSSIRAFSFLGPSLPVVDTSVDIPGPAVWVTSQLSPSCLLWKPQANQLGKASSLAVFGTTSFVLLFLINQLLASGLLTEVGFTEILISNSDSDPTRYVSAFQGLCSLLTSFLFLSYHNSTQTVPGTLQFVAVHPWKTPTFPSLTHRWCKLPCEAAMPSQFCSQSHFPEF